MGARGVVVIGRNEGERLVKSLESVVGRVDHVVYVDSGSEDGSVAAAKARGAEVVDLDMSIPFTAARARNAGWRRLREIAPDTTEALFIDDIEKADPALVNAPYEIEHFQHRGLVHAPLMENGVLWGILEPCVIAAPRAWTQDDRDVTAWVQERLTPLAIRYVRANCPA